MPQSPMECLCAYSSPTVALLVSLSFSGFLSVSISLNSCLVMFLLLSLIKSLSRLRFLFLTDPSLPSMQAEYMVSLCGDFNYIEFISNSKSGQFFFYSHDGRVNPSTPFKRALSESLTIFLSLLYMPIGLMGSH